MNELAGREKYIFAFLYVEQQFRFSLYMRKPQKGIFEKFVSS